MTELPSIRNRVLLVNLTFTKPQTTKLDKKATADAETANNAKGSLRTQRMLYPKHLLDPIVAVESEARAYLRRYAVEWGASGMYLLDTRDYMEVRKQLEEYRLKRKQEVTRFAQNWANVMQQAQQAQGTLFDASTYPDASEVVQEFKMHVHVAAFGEMAPSMFTDIEDEVREAITEDVEESTRDALADAVAQPLEKLLEAVMSLYDKTTRERTRLHDSLLEDLEQMTLLLERMNLTQSPRLATLARVCREKLAVPPETVRAKGARRQEVAGHAKGILEVVGVGNEELEGIKDPARRREVARETTDRILKQMEDFT